jgi:cellobiose-specific phosphotransferase system component IIB
MPSDIPVKIIMFHPNISSKKKLQDKFHAVIIHACDSHLAKRYHRDIRENNEKADFFILSPQSEYSIEGTIPINGIKSIPFEQINLKILYS